ncbi:MAG: sigma-70 family RNA polymerase sigma factor [Arachidicoccus sp.]|nr:sigma-70 family RNA polymerase sigma factor [Arachidicoccus sp.]
MLNYKKCTDAALLELLKAGNNAAFTELYYRYRDALAHYALQITGDEVEAADMVQQLFISFWTRRNELVIRVSLKAYFYGSIRNLAARYMENNIRKAKLLESFSYYFDQLTIHTPDSVVELNELQGQLQKVIDSMPSKMRQVYLLSREHQLNHKEIGLRLNIAESTVKKHVQNALKLISVVLSILLFFEICRIT